MGRVDDKNKRFAPAYAPDSTNRADALVALHNKKIQTTTIHAESQFKKSTNLIAARGRSAVLETSQKKKPMACRPGIHEEEFTDYSPSMRYVDTSETSMKKQPIGEEKQASTKAQMKAKKPIGNYEERYSVSIPPGGESPIGQWRPTRIQPAQQLPGAFPVSGPGEG